MGGVAKDCNLEIILGGDFDLQAGFRSMKVIPVRSYGQAMYNVGTHANEASSQTDQIIVGEQSLVLLTE